MISTCPVHQSAPAMLGGSLIVEQRLGRGLVAHDAVLEEADGRSGAWVRLATRRR